MGERGDLIASFAWTAVAGAVAALVVAAVLVAPILGDALTPDEPEVFDGVLTFGLYRPEPTEFLRYLFAVGAPLLVAAATLAWRPRPHASGRVSATAVSAVALVLLVVAWFSRSEPNELPTPPDNFFSDLEGLVAIVLAGIVVFTLRSDRARASLAALHGRRVAVVATAAAVVLTVWLLLPAIQSERSLLGASPFVLSHLPYYLSDYSAIGNGLTPLADHANHYAHLLPYLVAPVLAGFDYSPAALTVVLTVVSGLALLATFRGLVLAARSEIAGLALYVPVLGLMLLPIVDDADGLVFNGDVFSILPARLAAPFVIFWIAARHLSARSPRSGAVVAFAAGLAAWNNPEFGLPCAAGAAAALLLASWDPERRSAALRRVARDFALGLVAATALVIAITLLRSGELPDPQMLLYYSSLSGLNGFVLLPMPTIGLWIAVYITFAGTLMLAAVRAAAAHEDRSLTGLLGYVAVLGLGAGAYYVGRSDKFTMTAVLCVWALNLALLCIWAAREHLAAEGANRRLSTSVSAFGAAALIALCLGVPTLASSPAPWTEIDRITTHDPGDFDPFAYDAAIAFIGEQTAPDEDVLILREGSDTIATEAGVRNVSPVSEPQHIIGPEQLDFVLDALEASGGTKVFTGDASFLPLHDGLTQALEDRGWTVVAQSDEANVTEWERQP